MKSFRPDIVVVRVSQQSSGGGEIDECEKERERAILREWPEAFTAGAVNFRDGNKQKSSMLRQN